MGLAFSAFGLPGWSSIPTGQVYDQYFKDKKTDTFTDFHLAYVEFCKDFNTVLPGQDFDTPSIDQIRKFYDDTWKKIEGDDAKKKAAFMDFIRKEVSEASVDDSLFIMAGLAAPAGAVVLKKTGQSIPQLKRLDLVPNVLFVPLFTLAAIMGATAVQMKQKSKHP
ncbi:uncharacterized protein LOC102716930 [Oryza brachyantha]|uniref:Uncharacterized protein n=1 Tax=Oryza brachyantha TaxID=4533 RepID=J3L986_ORYBR|nr:uncharacterized protein LOC102716930 [Oryza brachyantha]